VAELTAKVRMVEGTLSLATSRTHSVAVDRAPEKGGTDLGFLGGELLLASLGGCLMSNLIGAARAREIALHRAEIQVRGVQADAPPRFAEIHAEVDLHADVAAEELDKLVTIAERACMVSNTLRGGTSLIVRRTGDR
jgi:putative redox protein